MRALILKEVATPPSLAIETVEDPVAGEGEVIVKLAAAALNHRELWICKGQYPGMSLPTSLGADGAGFVDRVGPGVAQSLLGQPVVIYPGLNWGKNSQFPAADFGLLGMPGPGTVAELVKVSASSVYIKPSYLDFHQAAALPLAGLTAWRGLTTKARLEKGERLLITGVGGGVGAQALLFAVAMGAEVWVTSGSAETIEWAKAHGAAGGVDYRTDGWGKLLAKSAGPIGVVFDGAPAQGYAQYMRALAMGARIVVYGSTGGLDLPVKAPELFLRNWTITGSNVGNPDEFAAMLEFVSAHQIIPVVEKVFPFNHALEALRYLEASHKLGKVVIDMGHAS